MKEEIKPSDPAVDLANIILRAKISDTSRFLSEIKGQMETYEKQLKNIIIPVGLDGLNSTSAYEIMDMMIAIVQGNFKPTGNYTEKEFLVRTALQIKETLIEFQNGGFKMTKTMPTEEISSKTMPNDTSKMVKELNEIVRSNAAKIDQQRDDMDALRRSMESIIDDSVKKVDERNETSEEGNSWYYNEDTEDISKKFTAYLMNEPKTLSQFKTFIRAMIISGHGKRYPIHEFKQNIKNMIKTTLLGTVDGDGVVNINVEQTEPEGFQGWK